MWIDGSLERKRVDLIVGKLNPIIEEIETNAMVSQSLVMWVQIRGLL